MKRFLRTSVKCLLPGHEKEEIILTYDESDHGQISFSQWNECEARRTGNAECDLCTNDLNHRLSLVRTFSELLDIL